MFKDRGEAEFLHAMDLNIEAINRATAGLPREQIRLHCCWGNWEGPHIHDVPLATLLPLLYRAKVGALSIEFANPRHQHEYEAIAQESAAAGHDPDSGRDRLDDEFRRASRGGRQPHLRGGHNRRRSQPGDRRQRLRLRHVGRNRKRSPPTWCGRSSRPAGRARISRRGGCGVSAHSGRLVPISRPSFRGPSQRVRPSAGPMTGSAREPGIHNHRLGVWIPGSRLTARPGMTAERLAMQLWRGLSSAHNGRAAYGLSSGRLPFASRLRSSCARRIRTSLKGGMSCATDALSSPSHVQPRRAC